MADKEKVLLEASFDPKVKTYWLLSGALILALTCVLSPLAILWLLLGQLVTERYLQTLRCTLTERSLKMKKGLFLKVEKTVPLDKITDLALVQGPIMRAMGLEALSVETAGQSGAGTGALVRLVGIVGTRDFRDRVLDQRDLVVSSGSTSSAVSSARSEESAADVVALLREIRDGLGRIEERMERREGGA